MERERISPQENKKHCYLRYAKEESWERGYLVHRSVIYLDMTCYFLGAALVISVLSINFNHNLVSRHLWIMYVTSVFAALVTATVDISIKIFHFYVDDWKLRGFYSTYIIFIIYTFLPMPFMLGPVLLGTTISFMYICYLGKYMGSKNYRNYNEYGNDDLSVDIMQCVCCNLLGIFFRLSSDIIVRSSFLDRHQYVVEEIHLRSARVREKILLHSILPPQIATAIQDDIRNRIAHAKKRTDIRVMDRIMTIQNHPEVSILYADVVNYTHLTTTLTVEKLVTLLHDLYGWFDLAASRFKVQRIKFLGDCYYCVAGLTRPNPDHAKCCVSLGMSMISHIRDVRESRQLDIDMRIGVHSGSVLAGVIGETKLQYDIWGQDVTIANTLESTGLPGHVHISANTLSNLETDEYTILPGTEAARTNPFLLKHNIVTYLVPAHHSARTSIHKLKTTDSMSAVYVHSREQSERVNRQLQEEFRKMPVGALYIGKVFFWRESAAFKQFHSQISSFWLHFRDPRLEWKYMRQPDYMFKYSALLAWIIGICLVYIQHMDNKIASLRRIFLDGSVLIFLTIIVFIAWYKKISWWRYERTIQDEPYMGYSKFSCIIFQIVEKIQHNITIRISTYLLIIFSYFIVIGIVLDGCNREEFAVLHIENNLYHYELDMQHCFHPFVLTDMVAIVMGMSCTFTRIPFALKTIVSTLEALVYLVIVFFQFEYVFHHSKSTNPFFPAENASAMVIFITLINLYLKERQTEFNSRVNYNWRMELKKKQHDAILANKSITILLHNILPAHVVNVYLTSLDKHELYYENYTMVSVMFASLKKFQMNLQSLRILNEIITEFDRLLLSYKEYYVVEKIKVVSCTYMAACGLDLNFAGAVSGKSIIKSSLMEEVERAQRSRAASLGGSAISENHDEVVFVMATFALDLMRTFWSFNEAYKNLPYERAIVSGDMSIGISSGEVMAGVVGASQAHYDIWGNTVNMASRMDSTGLVGHVQVTEETAEILQEFGIHCIYRGMTYVKGRGELPTYFVGIDDNYQFIMKDEEIQRSARHTGRRTTLLVRPFEV